MKIILPNDNRYMPPVIEYKTAYNIKTDSQGHVINLIVYKNTKKKPNTYKARMFSIGFTGEMNIDTLALMLEKMALRLKKFKKTGK